LNCQNQKDGTFGTPLKHNARVTKHFLPEGSSLKSWRRQGYLENSLKKQFY